MPSTVNGIGTWYWGKQNVVTRDDFCSSCHRFVQLKSYDTTKSFVILFLPLVPLGRKRIIDRCPLCTRHQAMSLKQWQHGRDVIVEEVVGNWRRQKHDREAAKEAIQVAVLFRKEDAFDEVAREMRGGGAQDAATHALLAAGYEYFNRLAEAEAELRAARDLQGDAGLRGSLVLNLLRQGRPDDAWPLLEEMLAQRDETSTWFLQMAAESYQSLGRHDNALYVIEQTLSAFPQQARNKNWAKLRKRSEKNYHTGRSVKGTTLQTQSKADSGSNRWVAAVGRAVIPVVILFALGYYLWLANAMGQNREVHVVNGLPVAYAVEVAGHPINLSPLGRRTVRVPEGDIRVRVVSDGLGIAEQTCRVETGFLSRPFSDRVFVINPDHAALMIWEETEYSVNPDPNAESQVEVHIGTLLHDFSNVDYAFQEFPEQIELPDGTPLKRRRVDQLRGLPPTAMLSVIRDRVDERAALAYLTALPLRDPDEDVICLNAKQLFDKAALDAALQDLLDDRPVRLEAHRAYQDLRDADLAHDLDAQYRQYLAAAPDDHALQYLLARVVEDRGEAVSLLERAARAKPPLARVELGFAFEHLMNARYDEAVNHVRNAEQIAPTCSTMYTTELYLLELMDDAEAVAQRLAQVRDALPYDHLAISHETYALARMNRAPEAQQRIDAWSESIMTAGGHENLTEFVTHLRATVHYVVGDSEQAAVVLAAADIPSTKFRAESIRGNWTAAAEALAGDDEELGFWRLFLAIAARNSGDDVLAQAQMDKAIAHLRTGNTKKRMVARWLASEAPLDVNAALRLAMYPNEKSIVLLALGMQFPEHREALFALARQLNARREFPHLTLAALLDGPAAGGP
jgi:tetratricopeptide (TPR) repeat protein